MHSMQEAEEQATICMNGGDGKTSYANNSYLQRAIISCAKRVMEESVTDAYKSCVPDCLVVADLGCATGPNVFVVASSIMSVLGPKTGHHEQQPSFLMYLNDLPSNDFNSIFKSLPQFYSKVETEGKKCFVAAVPGSFYGRLFPQNSIHFVHSSCALHFLSQVPNGLMSDHGEALNKGNICIGASSSPAVRKAYSDHFEKDFDTFLKARSEEVIHGGVMVLTLPGSVTANAPIGTVEVLGQALCDLASKGLISKSKLDIFNLPVYAPTADQIRVGVRKEGSFDISRLECFNLSWHAGMAEEDLIHASKLSDRAEFAANFMRAATEQILAATFGQHVMEYLFEKVAEIFSREMDGKDCYNTYIVVSLKRKG